MELPGLGLTAPSIEQSEPLSEERQILLVAGAEWRFEVSFATSITVRVLAPAASESVNDLNGTSTGPGSSLSDTCTAEIFGSELAPNHVYTFCGTKAAVYTHHGCTLSITGGPCESEYVAEETPMTEYTNLHFALEGMRHAAVFGAESSETDGTGPRVLVLGPENAGKTSLVKILSAYAVRSGRAPLVVNLDPREGMLCLPGSISAAVLGSGAVMDTEDGASGGWGNSPIAGPSEIPVKMPLVYHYGFERPDDRLDVFKPLVTRMALAVTSRLEADATVKETGLLIDPGGKISVGAIAHVVSELSVNVIVVLGSERLFSDVSRRFSRHGDEEDTVDVIKVGKSGGCVDRDDTYLHAMRHAAVRGYFFGNASTTLSPHTQVVDAGMLDVLRVTEPDDLTTYAFLPGGSLDESSPEGRTLFHQVTPSLGLQNAVLAIKQASRSEAEEAIRDASVAGYLYVADVDETKKKVKLLSPVGGKIPSGALVWGKWPEARVGDLLG
ncbi:MAG: Cleavage polyadenylation factor subunit clp1 [Chrysothrix sp. TS-e1954]|nr:MAG: Cleavage polyadenylation factor subunit clp1 [Chrysothrix sp. TS-e1954]